MMKISVVKNRISKFLDVTEDAFDSKGTESDLINSIILIFESNPQIFKGFLFKIFDMRVRFALLKIYGESDFEQASSIDDILPRGEILARIKILESETGLIFPRPVLSNTSFYMQIALLIVPALVFISSLLWNVEFLIVLYGLVKLGAIIFLIVIPYTVAYLLFPRFFKPDIFLGIANYKELIDDMVLTNQYFFVKEDYNLTKDELRNFIDSL